MVQYIYMSIYIFKYMSKNEFSHEVLKKYIHFHHIIMFKKSKLLLLSLIYNLQNLFFFQIYEYNARKKLT